MMPFRAGTLALQRSKNTTIHRYENCTVCHLQNRKH